MFAPLSSQHAEQAPMVSLTAPTVSLPLPGAAPAEQPVYRYWSCANCGEDRLGPKAKGLTRVAMAAIATGVALLAFSMPVGAVFLLAAVLAPKRQPAMSCSCCKCQMFWAVNR